MFPRSSLASNRLTSRLLALVAGVMLLGAPAVAGANVVNATALMSHYDLITLGDLSTSSEVEGRTYVGGSIVSGSASNYAIHLSVPAADETLLVVGSTVAGGPIAVNDGSMRIGGSTNGRIINLNGGGSLIADPSMSAAQVIADLQAASTTLGNATPNNTATLPSSQPGPAVFTVTATNACGVAIFTVPAASLFGNDKVQQIEVNPGAAETVLINVTGASTSWIAGNMVGNLTQAAWRSKILWNFPNATSLAFGGRNLMGALLAPFAGLTTSGNLDGSVAVGSLTTSAEVHQPEFSGNLSCIGGTTTSTLPVTTTSTSSSTISSTSSTSSSSTSSSTSSSSTSSSSTSTAPSTSSSSTTSTSASSTSSTSSSSTSSTTSSTSTSTSTTSITATTLQFGCGCDSGPAFQVAKMAKINNDAFVDGGISVNNRRGMIKTGKNIHATDGSLFVADYIQLGNAANVFGVETNHLSVGQSVTVRNGSGLITPPTPPLPLQQGFCQLAEPIECGTQRIDVWPGEQAGPLPPGVYGAVRILNGGTLRLAPGEFTFCSIKLGRGSYLYTDDGTVIDVESSVYVGSGSYCGPEDPADPTPNVNLAGTKLRVSQGATLRAAIVAPRGKFTFGRDSTLLGCFCGDQQKSDKHITLMCMP